MERKRSEFIMREKPTPEELQRIVDKWLPILERDLDDELFQKTAILMESQERWLTPEVMKFEQEYCCEPVNGGDK